MSAEDLETCQRYYEMVVAQHVPAPTCNTCGALTLYNLDTDDRVYFKCLHCNRISYPGSIVFSEMEREYRDWKNQ